MNKNMGMIRIKRNIFILFVAIMIIAACSRQAAEKSAQDNAAETSQSEENTTKMANIEGVNIEWSGQSSFAFRNDKIIYIDPFNVKDIGKADMIFITHGHYDHCSMADIQKIINPDTIIITVPDCQSKLSNLKIANVTLVRPGDRLNIKGTEISVVPAYNINKSFHPKENEWVGFIITINGKRIYHAGDTDFIPEMKNLTNIDVALVPIGGTYTMGPAEAANAVNEFRPKVAIPMHYGTVSGVGQKSDAEKFRSLAKVRVEILG
ncbi:MAG: MBL fold metallo-hydrolase [Candidatus Woesearchaeota archaeon]|nr:MBL fold metallo-hydrolase [Candidatus Woesearchaeota archaeon]